MDPPLQLVLLNIFKVGAVFPTVIVDFNKGNLTLLSVVEFA